MQYNTSTIQFQQKVNITIFAKYLDYRIFAGFLYSSALDYTVMSYKVGTFAFFVNFPAQIGREDWQHQDLLGVSGRYLINDTPHTSQSRTTISERIGLK